MVANQVRPRNHTLGILQQTSQLTLPATPGTTHQPGLRQPLPKGHHRPSRPTLNPTSLRLPLNPHLKLQILHHPHGLHAAPPLNLLPKKPKSKSSSTERSSGSLRPN
uniref:(northern house mosquito) hypothetical protein n=1 Tax=Culex pipiens TaxID=7175 RepID=A0A8D8PAS3_CULPI